MAKEKGANPVAAQRKADKRKEIAKSKRNVQEQRNEKLARRNPDRLQKQIDELKELESGGRLRPKDKETLTQLERDLRGIKRAREALGDAAPKFPSHERRNPRQEQQERRQHLGKRRRNSEEREREREEEEEEEAKGSDTDPDVAGIPMPRDTPPPIPREHFKDPQLGPDGQRVPHALPTKPSAPPAPAQLVYSSAPQMRDLKKEAAKFVPAAVRQKQKQARGQGRLLEAEEIDKLEQAGYFAAKKAAEEAEHEADAEQVVTNVQAAANPDTDMEAEMRKFEAEMKDIYTEEDEQIHLNRGVQLEEVEDAGD